MKRTVLILLAVFVGVFAWRVAERLSPDAIGMAVGMAFGVLAAVPTALLVMAAGRRREAEEVERRPDPRFPGQAGGYQPPVIVLAAPGSPYPGGAHPPGGYGAGAPALIDAGFYGEGLPQQPERTFRVIGEDDEWVE